MYRKRIRNEVESARRSSNGLFFLRPADGSYPQGAFGEPTVRFIDEYQKKIAAAQMPEAGPGQAERELGRLGRDGVILELPKHPFDPTYFDWLLAVPWSDVPKSGLNPKYAKEVLDTDHAVLTM